MLWAVVGAQVIIFDEYMTTVGFTISSKSIPLTRFDRWPAR